MEGRDEQRRHELGGALADQVRPRDPVRAPVFLDTPAKKTSLRSRPVDDGLSTRRS